MAGLSDKIDVAKHIGSSHSLGLRANKGAIAFLRKGRWRLWVKESPPAEKRKAFLIGSAVDSDGADGDLPVYNNIWAFFFT
eukprot:3605744-Rhodomonas_salina.1